MIEAGRKQVLALISQVRDTSSQAGGSFGAYVVTVGSYLGGGADYVTSLLADQASSIGHQIDLWRAGNSSTFKIISGDFQPGRALIVMDGLRLHNRGNALEIVPFSAIRSVQNLHTEKRASTVERAKGASIGSMIGGGVGSALGMFSVLPTGGLGAAIGGTLGTLLVVKNRYQTCRITLHDDRKAIAITERTNWLALLASIPEQPRNRLGWRRF
ncbi:hypothetical protein [uncultured Bradyrhizobium sp.]|uniref:hypothetical protein n=1 Tax=uncultured Bradyrhizobium sp. TaxID=199684 RepID=UPI0035C9E37F